MTRSLLIVWLAACAGNAPAPSPRRLDVRRDGGAAADVPMQPDAGVPDARVDAAVASVVADASVADAGVAVTAVKPSKPPPPPMKVVRVPFKMSDMDADAERRCAKALKKCKHVFAELEAPPSPCANQGTRCVQPMPQPTGWLCHCEQCQFDEDCGPGNYCETIFGACPAVRGAAMCLAGPRPPRIPCPSPREGMRTAPP